ncbi:MAG: hypothetical protein PVJ09_00150 [Candidatus Woesebacteria bacterium]|jgi:hypothetical protein
MNKSKTKKNSNYKPPASIDEARFNYRYRGKIVVASGGQVFGTKSAERAVKIVERLKRKYPSEVPTITYLPKKDQMLIPTLASKK